MSKCIVKINSTTLKQMTKGERLNSWKSKISCKQRKNCVKCSHLHYSALFVGRAGNFIICRSTKLHCVLPVFKRM